MPQLVVVPIWVDLFLRGSIATPLRPPMLDKVNNGQKKYCQQSFVILQYLVAGQKPICSDVANDGNNLPTPKLKVWSLTG